MVASKSETVKSAKVLEGSENINFYAAAQENRIVEVEGMTKTFSSEDDVIRDLRATTKRLQSFQHLTEKETDRIEHLLRCLQYEVGKKSRRKRSASTNFFRFSASRNEKNQKHNSAVIKKAEAEATVL